MNAREGIAKANRLIEEAFGKQDAALMVENWTDKARFLPPGEKPVEGHSLIQAYWQRAFDQGAHGLSVESVEIVQCGDWAYEVGRWRFFTPPQGASATERTGKSLCI